MPKVKPKGVADGNQVNIPEPAGSDRFYEKCVIIGFHMLQVWSREIAPHIGRTVNRHWWVSRIY